jgi:hypothetical protein
MEILFQPGIIGLECAGVSEVVENVFNIYEEEDWGFMHYDNQNYSKCPKITVNVVFLYKYTHFFLDNHFNTNLVHISY